MQASDIAAVLAIQAECYAPHMNEGESVIRQRLAASPDTAWVVEVAGDVVAYLVGYRSQLGKVTSLGGRFETLEAPDCLYLHDLAVSSQARGKGAADALVQNALAWANVWRLKYSALVSVQDSRDFWERHGYRTPQVLPQKQLRVLDSYRTPCWYMVRES